MESVTLNVPSISCEHCIKNITRIVTDEVAGVAEVTGDHEIKQVTIRYAPPATLDQIVASMSEWNFAPAL